MGSVATRPRDWSSTWPWERPEGGLRYIDVWETEADWDRFAEERLHPVVHPLLGGVFGKHLPPEPERTPMAGDTRTAIHPSSPSPGSGCDGTWGGRVRRDGDVHDHGAGGRPQIGAACSAQGWLWADSAHRRNRPQQGRRVPGVTTDSVIVTTGAPALRERGGGAGVSWFPVAPLPADGTRHRPGRSRGGWGCRRWWTRSGSCPATSAGRGRRQCPPPCAGPPRRWRRPGEERNNDQCRLPPDRTVNRSGRNRRGTTPAEPSPLPRHRAAARFLPD